MLEGRGAKFEDFLIMDTQKYLKRRSCLTRCPEIWRKKFKAWREKSAPVEEHLVLVSFSEHCSQNVFQWDFGNSMKNCTQANRRCTISHMHIRFTNLESKGFLRFSIIKYNLDTFHTEHPVCISKLFWTGDVLSTLST